MTKRFTGDKLLTQIVRPSAEIHKEFKTELILCDDGQLRTGLVIQETPTEIHFIANLLKPEKMEVIEKSSIEQRKSADISTMPRDFLTRLVNKKSTISSRTFKAGRSPNDERNRTEMETVQYARLGCDAT